VTKAGLRWKHALLAGGVLVAAVCAIYAAFAEL